MVGFALAASLSAQIPARQFTTNAHGWFMYFGDHPLKKGSPWGIHLEGQWRRHDVVTRWQQLLLRPALNYEVSKNLTLAAGYGFVNTSRYGALPPVAAASQEHRIFQQASLKQRIGKLSISHRYRLEERFLAEKRVPVPGGPAEFVRWRYENRFRYQFRIMRPIRGPWGIALYDEPFISFGDNVASNIFDQNRFYAAVTHTLGKANRLEVGYLNQVVQQRNGRVFENHHTLQVAIYSTRALR